MDDQPPAPPPQNPVEAIENKRRIFEFIRRVPGVHLRGIQRELAIPYGTAEYHLHALEDAGLVRTSPDGNLRRYFAADFAYEDREVLAMLRKRPTRRLVIALLERYELSHRDLAAAAGVKPPTLSYHLSRLEGKRIVAVRRDGRFVWVRLRDPHLMTRILIAHGRTFADDAVNRFLETFGGPMAPAQPDPAPRSAEVQDGTEVQAPVPPPVPLLQRLARPEGDE